MSEPVNSVTMKVLQPLWNQSSPRTNNGLACSYSEIGPKERALNLRSQLLLESDANFRSWFEYRVYECHNRRPTNVLYKPFCYVPNNMLYVERALTVFAFTSIISVCQINCTKPSKVRGQHIICIQSYTQQNYQTTWDILRVTRCTVYIIRQSSELTTHVYKEFIKKRKEPTGVALATWLGGALRTE